MREEKYTDMSLTDEQASLLGFKSLSMPEQYIQVKDARYTLDEFNRIGELLLGRNLTDDQQVVLESLHRRVAKLKAQEEKRLKAKYARVIRKLFPQLEPKLVAIAEGIAKIGKAMSK